MNTQTRQPVRGHHHSYTSPLRERQVEQTRETILGALANVLAEAGLADFSVPSLARRAGVSVRTVYRYFPTKDALLEAVAQWLDDHIVEAPWQQAAAADIARVAESSFAMFDQHPQLILAQWATPTGRRLRELGRRRRLQAYGTALREVSSHLTEDEQRSAHGLISYLLSSWTWKTLREEFQMTGTESGKTVAWAIRTLVEDLRRRNEEASHGSRGGAAS